jgi:hypothetical protein
VRASATRVDSSISEMDLMIVCGMIPCSVLYFVWISRRRDVSSIIRSIDPVIRSA